ncbi:MAG: hypothetical protein R2728_12605 [Chitinophagales bacterium]
MIIEDIIISRFSGTGLEYKASISNVIGIGSTANAFGAEDTETDVVFTAITSG